MSAAQRLDDLTGQLIVDGEFHLRLESTLSSGSYGRVYKALDIRSSTHYAVKCMARAEPGSKDHPYQQREIQTHQLVSGHPRIVTLHHHFATAEHVFLVLEYVAGGTLFSAVQRKSHGVAHRDIKPENFLCDEDGSSIRLADFGVVEITTNLCILPAGSRAYMSPESRTRGASLALIDQWAVAVTFTNIISNSGRALWKCRRDSESISSVAPPLTTGATTSSSHALAPPPLPLPVDEPEEAALGA
ncbi:Protein kinase domain-containing protein [Mycena kentingensis (nom. inval.)]|nr:Protein kinase domain-containing protein [Mycena kentingensis (nom. inval.)]